MPMPARDCCEWLSPPPSPPSLSLSLSLVRGVPFFFVGPGEKPKVGPKESPSSRLLSALTPSTRSASRQLRSVCSTSIMRHALSSASPVWINVSSPSAVGLASGKTKHATMSLISGLMHCWRSLVVMAFIDEEMTSKTRHRPAAFFSTRQRLNTPAIWRKVCKGSESTSAISLHVSRHCLMYAKACMMA